MNKMVSDQEESQQRDREAKKNQRTPEEVEKDEVQEKLRTALEEELQGQLGFLREALARRRRRQSRQSDSGGGVEKEPVANAEVTEAEREIARVEGLLENFLSGDPKTQAEVIKDLNELFSNFTTAAGRKLRDFVLDIEKYRAEPSQLRALVLSLSIQSVKKTLELRERMLKEIEQEEWEERYAAAISPTGNVPDRFSRAETAVDRRMYRALGALIALQLAEEKLEREEKVIAATV